MAKAQISRLRSERDAGSPYCAKEFVQQCVAQLCGPAMIMIFRSASVSLHPHRKHLRPRYMQANGHLPAAQGRQITAPLPRRHPSQLVAGQHIGRL